MKGFSMFSHLVLFSPKANISALLSIMALFLFTSLASQEVVKYPLQFDQELSSQLAQQKNLDNLKEDPNLINPLDLKLVEIAREKLKDIVVTDKIFVVTAMRTKSGTTFTGINLKTTATRASVCAESNTLAKAIESQHNDIETIVTLAYLPDNQGNHKLSIVSPCGLCRELLYDYAPDVRVIIFSQGALRKVPISELLIYPYKR
jgi:cytidine deaminase